MSRDIPGKGEIVVVHDEAQNFDLPRVLELVEQHAPRLRAVGVLQFSFRSTTFTLAPAQEPEGERIEDDQPEEKPGSVLEDPFTHGRTVGDNQTVIRAPKRRPL